MGVKTWVALGGSKGSLFFHPFLAPALVDSPSLNPRYSDIGWEDMHFLFSSHSLPFLTVQLNLDKCAVNSDTVSFFNINRFLTEC